MIVSHWQVSPQATILQSEILEQEQLYRSLAVFACLRMVQTEVECCVSSCQGIFVLLHGTTCSAGDLKGSKIRASAVSCKYLFRHLTPIQKPSLRSVNYTRAIAFSSLVFSLPFAKVRSLFSFDSRERDIFAFLWRYDEVNIISGCFFFSIFAHFLLVINVQMIDIWYI